jgi:hypothetical protein
MPDRDTGRYPPRRTASPRTELLVVERAERRGRADDQEVALFDVPGCGAEDVLELLARPASGLAASGERCRTPGADV